ncbi:AAA family ATPase [Rhodococcus fascians]|uniref:AAA family ATPase n=1 Tax=Nocardiaceae TaxID=85025 RepID=UPI0019D22347|nr:MULTISPECIES: AAA family ATPase [Rhodococcus]MBW4780336.1 AAA family ATPase [Rhodococcus fascians]MDJ0005005.1 AAA family ATPase [Rhodococcus fascians]
MSSKDIEREPIPRERLYPSTATAEDNRRFSDIVDKYRAAERDAVVAQANRAVAEHLVGRIALHFPYGDGQLDAWASVLDRPEDIPAEAFEDGGENITFQTAGNRFVDAAESAGRVWRSDHALSGRHDVDPPLVLFFELSSATTQLIDSTYLDTFPDLTVFGAAVGLPRTELTRHFHAAGLNLDDFEPWLPAVEWTAEICAALTSAAMTSAALTSEATLPTIEDVAMPTDTAPDSYAEHERNVPLDLKRLRTEERLPVQYLEPGVIPCGRYIGVSGEAGAGKSLLARDLAVSWSLGRSTFDPAHTFDPVRVVYLDAENGPEWWADGLDTMNAPLDLPNLRVITYPDLDGGLDTPRGARLFLELIEALGEIDVLVLDTASRFIAGSENDSDTWHALYRRSILPLRRAGIEVVRLDHLGKNAELGARGSSAKMSDLDAHYILTASAKGSNSLTLKLDKRRQADYAESVRIKRRDNPLTHTRIPEGKFKLSTSDGREVPANEKVAALVAELDRLHIAASLSRRVQQSNYIEKAGIVKAGTDTWAAAVKFRSERIDREAEL